MRIDYYLKNKIFPKNTQEHDPPELLNWDNGNFETNGEYFFLRTYSKKFKVVFDIGANVGEYSKKIIELNPRINIHIFEPNPELQIEINKNAPNQKIIKAAVGSTQRNIKINFNQNDHTQSSIYRKNTNTKVAQVSQITLDNYSEKSKIKFIDLVKIDTEGHELEVLKGSRKLIKAQAIGMIQFEYGGTYQDAKILLKDVYNLLQNKYIICHLSPKGLIPIQYSSDLETFRYSNWVAIARNLYV